MKWIPFFKSGKQTDSLGREKEWTNDELDKIVTNYNSLMINNKRPIVIGHPKTNLPIVGYIDKVRRVNDTLFALPSLVADSFKELVNNGDFPERSISINNDGSINHFGFLPKGVKAAVKNLGEYSFSESDECTVYSFNGLDIDSIEEEIEESQDILRIQAELELINKQIELMSVGSNNKSNKSQHSSVIKDSEQEDTNSFSNQLEKFVAEGKISPSEKSKIVELKESEEKLNNFEQVDLVAETAIIKTLNLLDRRVEFSEIVTKQQVNTKQSTLELIAKTYK